MGEEKQSLAERLKRDSHRICALILNSDLEWIDISIEINEMRERCLAEAPDKAELFEAIYASRFERLWTQWREKKGEGCGAIEANDPEEEWLNEFLRQIDQPGF